MFSKADSKRLREDFWISFGKSFPREWILYDTKIKGLTFKFYFDLKFAHVAMEIDHASLEKRIDLWEKINSLKTIITTDFLSDAKFDDSYIVSSGKEVSRVYIDLHNVSIHNKNTWQETMVFLKEKMIQFELFFEEYKDILT